MTNWDFSKAIFELTTKIFFSRIGQRCDVLVLIIMISHLIFTLNIEWYLVFCILYFFSSFCSFVPFAVHHKKHQDGEFTNSIHIALTQDNDWVEFFFLSFNLSRALAHSCWWCFLQCGEHKRHNTYTLKTEYFHLSILLKCVSKQSVTDQ